MTTLQDFIEDKAAAVWVDSRYSGSLDFYSGSFNPLHQGHLEIVNHYAKAYKIEPVFEVCITRFDKLELTFDEVLKIKAQFDSLNRPVIFTRLPTFLQKVVAFRDINIHHAIGFYENMNFIVGGDTLLRINDTKYYFDSLIEKERVFSELTKKYVKFIVYERHGNHIHHDWLHRGLKDLCVFTGYTPKAISSTELRSKEKNNELHIPKKY